MKRESLDNWVIIVLVVLIACGLFSLPWANDPAGWGGFVFQILAFPALFLLLTFTLFKPIIRPASAAQKPRTLGSKLLRGVLFYFSVLIGTGLLMAGFFWLVFRNPF
jgi:hypothetical protein